jgi:hypothetical protein
MYNHENMTDLQWEEYRKQILGKRVHWTAMVYEVDEDGKITLDMGEPSWAAIYLEGVPRETLLETNKGSTIEFEATLSDMYDFLFFYVQLNNPKILSIN